MSHLRTLYQLSIAEWQIIPKFNSLKQVFIFHTVCGQGIWVQFGQVLLAQELL